MCFDAALRILVLAAATGDAGLDRVGLDLKDHGWPGGGPPSR
ncbi:hypothetical protein DB30_04154 [Enhygromyxa salina]|uniref:Uncharacterized protein n=1 Tax=Enhygromyxa salina TaxID=215803 RepID=A0A0C1ZLA0_9BACT|nr:hypothetical protein [Enhygromyxa salina]KIG11503.1 hypothetical protein DB30_04154 [Enhygromyxa salina]